MWGLGDRTLHGLPAARRGGRGAWDHRGNNFPIWRRVEYTCGVVEVTALRRLLMTYTPAPEAEMRRFYASLSVKDRRRYAAIKTAKLGQGTPPTWPRSAAAIPRPSVRLRCDSMGGAIQWPPARGDPQTISPSSMRPSLAELPRLPQRPLKAGSDSVDDPKQGSAL